MKHSVKLVLMGLLLWPWPAGTGPSGGTLVATDEPKSSRLIPRKQMTQEKPVPSVVFSPDGKTLASGGGVNSIILWDVTTGKEKATLTRGGEERVVSSVAFSPDGKTLASGSRDHTIKLWDVATGKQADK